MNKVSYSDEDLKKLGRYIEVPKGKEAEVLSTINCSGWLIFIPDKNEDEMVKTSFNLRGNRN